MGEDWKTKLEHIKGGINFSNMNYKNTCGTSIGISVYGYLRPKDFPSVGTFPSKYSKRVVASWCVSREIKLVS